jgi:two-component system, response regulator PdtaR
LNKIINILLVEDEIFIAMYMAKVLKSAGFPNVSNVTNGNDAIIISERNPPDLILMDIRLAGELDGIDTALRIKTFIDIPVIFITSYDDNDLKDKAKKANPLKFMIKPVDIVELSKIIDNYFQ